MHFIQSPKVVQREHVEDYVQIIKMDEQRREELPIEMILEE
jgi:hypothetical protein